MLRLPIIVRKRDGLKIRKATKPTRPIPMTTAGYTIGFMSRLDIKRESTAMTTGVIMATTRETNNIMPGCTGKNMSEAMIKTMVLTKQR